MDSRKGDIGNSTTTTTTTRAFDNIKPKITKEKSLASKVMDVGSISDRKLYVRADKIDWKTLEDVESVKKQIRRLWIDKKEEWQIDSSKLDLRYVIAKGTYATIYRGVYGDQDVAGIFHLHP